MKTKKEREREWLLYEEGETQKKWGLSICFYRDDSE